MASAKTCQDLKASIKVIWTVSSNFSKFSGFVSTRFRLTKYDLSQKTLVMQNLTLNGPSCGVWETFIFPGFSSELFSYSLLFVIICINYLSFVLITLLANYSWLLIWINMFDHLAIWSQLINNFQSCKPSNRSSMWPSVSLTSFLRWT